LAELTGFSAATLPLGTSLEQLNLTESMLRQLVERTTSALGVVARIDLAPLRGKTLQDLARVLEAATSSRTSSTPAPIASSPQWSREFDVVFVEEPADLHADWALRTEDDWTRANVVIVSESTEAEVTDPLSELLMHKGARVQNVNFASGPWPDRSDVSHWIAVLPRNAPPADARERLTQAIARLRCVALVPAASQAPRRRTTVAYVQFGGGRFGAGLTDVDPRTCCADAFARTLHLERDDLRVRVIDLSPASETRLMASQVVAELSHPEAFSAVGHDVHGVRRVPQARLRQPADYPAEIPPGPQDVILVTGGARGITAECALALASKTGVKLALLGRSPEPSAEDTSSEVAKTLRRCVEQGVTARYFAADVTREDSLRGALQAIREQMGPITGVIHGAALNMPRLLSTVSTEQAVEEVAPKWVGAANLMELLKDAPPRLFIALTSIIGVTGMTGNGWYAFANESVERMLAAFGRKHPSSKTLSIAFGLWSGVGMGERLGAAQRLKSMGIGALEPADATRRFVHAVLHNPHASQLIISARTGGLDTWPTRRALPARPMRFVQKRIAFVPDVEWTGRVQLSVERDPYLKDHDYNGSLLFPTVFGLEAMAEALVALGADPVQLEDAVITDIRLERPIVVPRTGSLEIEIHVLALESPAGSPRRFQAGIRSAASGFATDHFSAIFELDGEREPDSLPWEQLEGLDLVPTRDLYGPFLFQGPSFQRMGKVMRLNPEQTVLETNEAAPEESPFASGEGTVLADPYFRDVLLQSAQLLIPHQTCLPIAVERWERSRRAHASGERRVTTLLVETGEVENLADVVSTDASGAVLERLTGYRLRILQRTPEKPTADELARPAAYDQKRMRAALTDAANGLGVTLPFVALSHETLLRRLPQTERRERASELWAKAWSKAASDNGWAAPAAKLGWEASGRPVLEAAPKEADVSFSHDDSYLLAVIGDGPLGCDLEPVTPRSADAWRDLFGTHHAPFLDSLMSRGDVLNLAGTRLWSTLEAVFKALGTRDVELRELRRNKTSVLLEASANGRATQVLTVVVPLTRGPERVVALSLPAQRQALETTTPNREATSAVQGLGPDSWQQRVELDGPQGQPVQEVRFVVSFQESNSASRRVPFARYANWMGKMRELTTASLAPKLIQHIAGGQFGLVTTWAQVQLLGELHALDGVEMRCWADDIDQLSVEFLKIGPHGPTERLAMAKQQFRWVRMVGHGQVVPEEMPAFLKEWMEQMVPRRPGPPRLANVPEPLKGLQRGPLLGAANRGPQVPQTLLTQRFATSLEESNLVGNIYYSNYFAWEARTLDRFLYKLAPEWFGGNASGELAVLGSRIDYLREAMPFQDIETSLEVTSVHSCGADFSVTFFRVEDNGERTKLSRGSLETLWGVRGPDGRLTPQTLPLKLQEALLAHLPRQQAG